jgi:glycosyltransferase involved in cell wall biosynthesis
METAAQGSERKPPPPFVSILLPVLNEARFLEACLHSIEEQDYPADRREVLILDGGSTDGTQDLARAFAAAHAGYRLVNNPGRTQVKAFNLGVKQSRGEIVVRMDAHAEYRPTYVRRCVETLRSTGAANVGGMWDTRPGSDSWMAKAIAVIGTQRFGIGGARFRVGGQAGPTDTVPFGAFRRDLFDKVGLLDERLARGEDNEFNARIRRHGLTVYFDPAIGATYYGRRTFGGFMKQLAGNGFYHMLTLKVNPRGCSLRHFVPLAFVLLLVACGVAGLFWTPAWWIGASVLGLYLAADLAASFLASRKYGWWLLAVLPWLFFCAHVCYGVSTLAGIFRFGLVSSGNRGGRTHSGAPGGTGV